MKKVFAGLLAAAMVFSATTTMVSAAGRGMGRNYVDADGDGVCDNWGTCSYVDADGDGVCDNWGTCGYVDEDGDGICDNCGVAHGNYLAGNGRYFIDADGDGVCDNYAAGCLKRGRGRGRGNSGCGRFGGGRNR